MSTNERTLIQLSADSRALVRAAIRANAGWKAYQTANDCDLSTMTTKEVILDCCDALGIDVAAVVAAGPVDAPKPVAEPRKPRAPTTADIANGALARVGGGGKSEADSAGRAIPGAFAAPIASDDAAKQLLAIIAGLAPKAEAIDESRVHAIVREHILTSEAAIDGWISTAIAHAIKNIPAIRIELTRGDEIRPVDGHHHHPQFPKLLRALSARQSDSYSPNVWISGPAGSGKTFAAKAGAVALGVSFRYNGALSMPHELLGFIDAAGNYHRTPFREAYEHGGVYLFDEVDGSDNSALLALNAALANGTATFPDCQITRHRDCYIVATANTWGLGATADYVGRSKIDAAFLSRFPVRIGWDYDEKLEQAICGNPHFAKRVQAARRKGREAGIKVLIDPRASIAGAALIAAGMTDVEAAEMTYLANLSADQRRMIEG